MLGRGISVLIYILYNKATTDDFSGECGKERMESSVCVSSSRKTNPCKNIFS